jgi:hypothetical protein
VNRVPFAGLVLLALASGGADEPLPLTLPLAPAEAFKSFQVRDGFRLDLLAAEPLVIGPGGGGLRRGRAPLRRGDERLSPRPSGERTPEEMDDLITFLLKIQD